MQEIKHPFRVGSAQNFGIMGSLMAGWSTPFQDPDTVNLERNRSATKEEIESFWKMQKMEEEAKGQENDSQEKETETHHDDPNIDQEASNKGDGWWTKSRWAYLNEPPKDDTTGRSHRYTAQFHVAEMATKKSVYAV